MTSINRRLFNSKIIWIKMEVILLSNLIIPHHGYLMKLFKIWSKKKTLAIQCFVIELLPPAGIEPATTP